MKRILIIVLVLCLVGCSSTAPVVENSEEVYEASAVTKTLVEEPVEDTPEPTETLLPTETLEPTITPSPTPLPEPITANTADNIQIARKIGNGYLARLVWSPDGKKLLVLSSDFIELIDAEVGEKIWSQETDTVQTGAAFIDHGKNILTNSSSGVIRRYGAASGKLLSDPYDSFDFIYYSSLSDEGTILELVLENMSVALMDVDSGKFIQGFDFGATLYKIIKIAIAPDEKTMVVGGFNRNYQFLLNKWDIETGKFIGGFTGISRGMDDVKYSPDGSLLGGIGRYNIGSDVNTFITIWNAETRQSIKNFDLKQDITSFEFMPDGEAILVAYRNGNIEKLDIETGESLGKFEKHYWPIMDLSISPDGSKVVSGGADGTVCVWDAETYEELNVFFHEMSLSELWFTDKFYIYYYTDIINPGMALSPDGQEIAITSPDRRTVNVVDFWDGTVERSFGELDGQLSVFAFSPDGSILATIKGGDTVIFWDFEKGEPISSFDAGHTWEINKTSFSPDGKLFTTLCEGEIFVWDVETAEKITRLTGNRTMRFSPDSSSVASDNLDYGMYLWDVQTGRQIASPFAEYIIDLDYSPDGKTIALAGIELEGYDLIGPLVYFIDAETYERLPLEITDMPVEPTVIRYSPDGTVVVTCDGHGDIIFWDSKSGAKLSMFSNIIQSPAEMYFTPDGEYLVVGSMDGTILYFGTSELPIPSGELVTS